MSGISIYHITPIPIMKKATSMVLIAVLLISAVPPYHADAQGDQTRIDGAGASFAFPLMDLWRVKYAEVRPDVQMNYQSIGSGGGVTQHIQKTVNFAASDVPLRDSEYERAPDTLTIPVMIGAISLVYNIPGVDTGIRITPEALCDMHLGKIKSWNDPLIAEANPDLEIPDQDVIIVHRSDGSGTTFAFTSYLTKVCPEWDERVGAGKSVPWPIGIGSPGNEGVAGIVTTTEGSIGYVTLAYAFQNDLTTAAIENGDETNFVLPTLESASDASEGAAATLPAAQESWRSVDLLAAPGDNSYPITSFSYILLHPDLKGSVRDLDHAVEVVNLVAWIITDGQEFNDDLLYVPIAAPVANIGLEGLSNITYDGQPVYAGPVSVEVQEPEEDKIPAWVQQVFKFYGDGLISDDELISAITYLINQGIITLE